MGCGTKQHNSGLGRLIVEFLDHTHKHTSGRTPLNEWSARHRDLCLHNTQQTQKTKNHALSGTRTRDPDNRAASDLRLGHHGHLNPQT